MKPVLIIDDSELRRQVTTHALNTLGIKGIIEASTGAAGLNNLTAFSSDAYSLIILNYDLPDRTAVEMVTSIRLVEPTISILIAAAQGIESCVHGQAVTTLVRFYLRRTYQLHCDLQHRCLVVAQEPQLVAVLVLWLKIILL